MVTTMLGKAPKWARASDQLPEMQELIAVVEKNVPRFVRLKSDAPAWIAKNGLPSDLVPTRSHPLAARILRGGTHAIVDVFACCGANRWKPLNEGLRTLGTTLVLCGQRRTDLSDWNGSIQVAEKAEPGGPWKIWYPIRKGALIVALQSNR